MDLSGKVALVTGAAAGGIGEASARALAAAGATVVVSDVQDELGEGVAHDLGAPHRYLHLDVTDLEAWDRALRTIADELGGLDLVHLNAGTFIALAASESGDPTQPRPGWLEEETFALLTPESYRRTMAVNCDGVYYGLIRSVPYLEARGGGSIMVTVSLAGIAPFNLDPLYAMTKHALTGLVSSTYKALARRRITINGICPGITDTKLHRIGGGDSLERGAAETGAEAGAQIMPPAEVAESILAILETGETGGLWVKMNRETPVYRHRFADLPQWGLDW